MQSIWRAAASSRRRTVAALAALTLGLGVATVIVAEPALADPIAPITFTAAGNYAVPVPPRAVAVTLIGVGGAGFAGDPSAVGGTFSPGGVGGSGTQVAETLPVNSAFDIAPDDVLIVVVGAKGGGGQRGYNGGNLGGDGGNGGGATSIHSSRAIVLGAGGGGGGGGGGAGFSDENGGMGGTDEAGAIGTDGFKSPAGAGGALGDGSCAAGTTQATAGQAGETTGTVGNSGGGGGGGGEGFCGGGGGGSGDHGVGGRTGGSGGGGGGAGGSVFDDNTVLDEAITPGTNTGDGSVSITFDLAPAAILSPTDLAFDPQAIGVDSPSQLIAIVNIGNYPMVLDSIGIGGADIEDFQTSRGSCGEVIASKSYCMMAVTFDPSAPGPRTATITVSDNHGLDLQTITLSGVGQAPAAASFSASSIDFGGVPVGSTTAPKFVTLTNTGDVPLPFTGLSLDGGDGGEFDGNTGTCGDTIAPHDSCQVGALFHPSSRAVDATTLIVNTGTADSPQRIALTGTGQGPAIATLSATSIDFGGQPVGVISAPQYVTLTNTGDRPLTLQGLSADGADPNDFSGLSQCPALTLTPGASCQIGGTFTPTASGSRSATFHVYDTADATPQTITLTGVGQTPAAASFSASSLDFGGVPIGSTTAPQFLTLTNTGDVPLPFNGLSLDGADAGQFDGDPGTCGDAIAPHDSCQVGAVFHPSSRGTHSTTLIVNYGSTGGSQPITLTGTGQGPAIATLNATTITFPAQPVGLISAPQYITLTNTGDRPLSFDGIAAGGVDPADFSGLTYCATTIAPGGSCRIGGTFTPHGTGTRSATFYVYDSADTTPQAIILTGTGTARPAAPTIGAATGGNGTATVAFTAPSSTGGTPITGYTATATDLTTAARGGQTATGTGAPLTVPGLTNGDRYTVSVTATNAVGTSPASASSNAVTPTTPVTTPSAPRALTATVGNAQVTLAWTAPLSANGSAITGYNVYEGTKAGGEHVTPLNTSPLPATTSSYLVKGLTNNSPYFFTVRAINAVGASAASNEVTATPTALLTVTTTSLPSGQVGVHYSDTLAATGGLRPYHWSLVAGTLPAGLTLATSGALTGTPTRSQSANLTFRLTDSSGSAKTVTKQLTLTVKPAPRAADLKITATHLGTFVSGQYGGQLLTVSNTGDAPTTAATTVVFTMPSGLTYVGSTGNGWSCSRSGATITCIHKGFLPAAASSAISLVTRVTARAGQVLITTATVSPIDLTPADNTATDRLTVGPNHSKAT
jgi:hypothetical protein